MIAAFRAAGAGVPLAIRNWTDAWRGVLPVNANAVITVFTAPGARSPSVQGIPPVQSIAVETSRSVLSPTAAQDRTSPDLACGPGRDVGAILAVTPRRSVKCPANPIFVA